MSRQLTFAEACSRFGPLVTTDITIEDAIQHAVDRIFEIGRWAGTTEEIELAEGDFVFDSDTDEYFISFDEATYNGAIGFRSAVGGWSIVDKTALYKDGVNAGDREFVDYGTIPDDEEETAVRKYRCPLGFAPSAGPYYALLKKEPPTLYATDIVPVKSVGALQAAIQAIAYEFVNDETNAANKWAQFEQLMGMSQRQSEGPKRWNIGLEGGSFARKPRQFY